MAESLGEAVLDLRADAGSLIKTVKGARVATIKEMVTAARESKVQMAAGMAAVGVAVGVGLYKVGSEFDKAYDAIRTRTGATGKALESLKDSFRNVAKDVPNSFEEVGDAIGEVNQRLDLSGKPLEERAKQFLNLSHITGTDLHDNIKAVSRAFVDAEVPVHKQGKALDGLFRISQATGIEVADLATKMQQFGSPMRQLGFSFAESAALFAEFEKSGVNMETMVPGLKMAISNLTKPTSKLGDELEAMGIKLGNPKAALKEVFKIMQNEGVPQITKTSLAMSVFGKRAGADMAEAIRQGRFSVGKYIELFEHGKGTINDTANDTADLSEKLDILRNRGMLALEKPAMFVFDGMSKVASALIDVSSAIEGLPAPVRTMIGQFVVAAAGTMVLVFAFTKVKAAYLAMRMMLMSNPYVSLIAATAVVAYLLISHWKGIKGGLGSIWGSIVGAAKSAFASFTSVVAPVGRAALWVDRTLTSMVRFIGSLPAKATTLARNIGIGIVNGVLSGVGDLANLLRRSLEGSLRSAVIGLSPFSPVEHGGEKYIGEPLGSGAIKGWVYGSANLPNALSDRVRESVDAARQTVEAERGRFADSWSQLTEDALSAFDAIQAQIHTKSEKLLKELQQKHQQEALLGAIKSAREELTEAESRTATKSASAALGEAESEASSLKISEGETPEEFAKRQADAAKKVEQAKQALADAEASDAKRIVDVQKRLDDALGAQQEARLQSEAEKERKELDARIALKRRHFEQALEALSKALSREGASREEANKRTLSLLRKFGVSYKGAGSALGQAFATGLEESQKRAGNAAQRLASLGERPLRAVGRAATEAKSSLKDAGSAASGAAGDAEGLGLAMGSSAGKIKGVKNNLDEVSKTKVGDSTKDAEDSFKKLGLIIGGVSGALIALRSSMVRGALVSAFGMLVSALGRVKTAFEVLRVVMLSNPYVAITAATIAIAVLVITHWDQIKQFLSNAWHTVKATAVTVWNSILQFFKDWWPLLLVVFTGGMALLPVLVIRYWGKIKELMTGAWDGIKASAANAWEAIKSGVENAWGAVLQFFKDWWPLLLAVTTGGLSLILGVVVKHWDDIKAKVEGVADKIKEVASNSWEAVRSTVADKVEAVRRVVGDKVDAVRDKLSDVWRTIKGAVSGAWEDVRSTVADKIEAVRSFVAGKVDDVREKLSNAWSTIKEAARTAWQEVRDFIKNPVSNAVDAVYEAIKAVAKWLGEKWDAMVERAEGFGGSIKTVLEDAFAGAANAVIDFINAIIKAINVLPGVSIGEIGHVSVGGGGKDSKGKGKGKGSKGRALATGGAVMVPGIGSGDTVPVTVGGVPVAMVEPGEILAVVNRDAATALMAVNSAIPREGKGRPARGGLPGFSVGGIIDGLTGKAASLITGGIDALPSPSDFLPTWLVGMGKFLVEKVAGWVKDKATSFLPIDSGTDIAKLPSATLESFLKMVATADAIDAKHYPYVYGGGHDGSFSGPYDCSGAVSAILHAGGLLSSPQTTDGLKTFGAAGDGTLVTVGVRGSSGRDAHTMMLLGTKGFESGGSNGGAGWTSGWDGDFPIHRHPSGMSTGGILGTLAQLLSPERVGWGLSSGGTLPFLGSYHSGGVAPAEGYAHVLKGERMTPAGKEPVVELNFANGMEWLRDFVDVRVGERDRRTHGRHLAGALA